MESPMNKSTPEEIRARFDADVERFSNLETGQTATIDGRYCLELVTEAAARTTPHGSRLLDVGCGAGNFSLMLLQRLPPLEVTLVDLSRPMLDRAVERLTEAGVRMVTPIQGDIRSLELGTESFDIILAAAVLQHLRSDDEWISTFAAFYRALAPGGSLWIFDLVESNIPAVHKVLWDRYAQYLETLGGAADRDRVLDYIEREDTPRPAVWQIERLADAGFSQVDRLHAHGPFAAFGAVE